MTTATATRRQALDGPPLQRSSYDDVSLQIRADEAVIDEENQVIRVTFSSEFPVLRRSFFDDDWIETLGHDAAEVLLDRLNAGAPVLYNHARSDDWSYRDTRIGVVQRAWIEKDRGHAELKISRREDVAGVWRDIQDGVLCNVSVGYKIHERTLIKENGDGGPDEYRVNRWEPLEISLVDIPADYTVGVGRSQEKDPSTKFRIIELDDKRTEAMPSENPTPENNPTPDANVNAIAEQARKEAIDAEKKRRVDVRAVFEHFPQCSEIRDTCLDDPGITVEQARKLLLDELGKDTQPVNDPIRRIDAGETDREKFRKAAENWLPVKAGMKNAKRDAQNELNGYTLREVVRRSLELCGNSTRGMDEAQMLQRAIVHGSSDFPAITENIANKMMMEGFEDADETYEMWVDNTGSLSDFKIASLIDVGGFNAFREVKPGGEIKYVSTSDGKEQIQLATFAERFSIDRQTLINDDVGAFTMIPMEFGRAARATVGNLVYGILTGNPKMRDNVTLFHANHGNLLTGATPTTGSVNAMRVAMGTQKRTAVTDRASNIRLAYLVVPLALQGIALQIKNGQFEITSTGIDSTRPNHEANQFEVIAESRLDDDDPAVWYGAARRRTIKVAYLNGRREPMIMRKETTDVLGVEWVVYLDAAAKALDWRTIAKNPGS